MVYRVKVTIEDVIEVELPDDQAAKHFTRSVCLNRQKGNPACQVTAHFDVPGGTEYWVEGKDVLRDEVLRFGEPLPEEIKVDSTWLCRCGITCLPFSACPGCGRNKNAPG